MSVSLGDPNTTDTTTAANGQAVNIHEVKLYDGTSVFAIDEDGIIASRGVNDWRFAEMYDDLDAVHDSFGTGGGRIYLPLGDYDIDAAIAFTKRTILEGYSPIATVLKVAAGSDFDPITITASMSRLLDLEIDGDSTNQSVAHPLVRFGAADCKIENVWVYKSKGHGVQLDSGWNLRVLDSWIETCDGVGLYVVPASDLNVNTLKLTNATIINNAGGGIYADLTNCTTAANRRDWMFSNVNVQTGDEAGCVAVYLKDLSFSKFSNVVIGSQTDHALSIDASDSGNTDTLMLSNVDAFVNMNTAGKYSINIANSGVRRIYLSNCRLPNSISDTNINYITRGSMWHGASSVGKIQPLAGTYLSSSVEVGVSASDGAATTITPNSGVIIAPRLKFTVGGSVAGGEVITVTCKCYQDSGSSQVVTHAYDAGGTGDYWFTDADWMSLLASNNSACYKAELYANASTSSTSATVTGTWRSF